MVSSQPRIRRLIIGLGVSALVAGGLFTGASAAQASVRDVDPVPAPGDPAPAAILSTQTTVSVPAEVTFGSLVVADVSVEGPEGEPVDGTVHLTVPGTPYDQVLTLEDGVASAPLEVMTPNGIAPVLLYPGPQRISGTFVPADPAAYAGSSDTLNFTSVKAPTTVHVLTWGTVTAFPGRTVTLGASIDEVTYVGFGGEASFYQDDVYLGSATFSYYRIASLTVPVSSLGLGTSTLRVEYSGDGNFLPASAQSDFTVVEGTSGGSGDTGTGTGGDTAAGSGSGTGSGGATLAATGAEFPGVAGISGALAALIGLGALIAVRLRRSTARG